jgi:hypothetical protein
MKVLIFILLVLLLSLESLCQGCGRFQTRRNDVNNNSSLALFDECSVFSHEQLPYVPIKTVQLVIHVVQKDDGSSNFDTNYKGHQDFFDRIINDPSTGLNAVHSSMCAVVDGLEDSRLRFNFDTSHHLFEWQDTELWDNSHLSCRNTSSARDYDRGYDVYDAVVKNNNALPPELKDAIHYCIYRAVIFMTQWKALLGLVVLMLLHSVLQMTMITL